MKTFQRTPCSSFAASSSSAATGRQLLHHYYWQRRTLLLHPTAPLRCPSSSTPHHQQQGSLASSPSPAAADPILYLVTDNRPSRFPLDNDSAFIEHVLRCVKGGDVDFVQYRDKHSPRDVFLRRAKALKEALDEFKKQNHLDQNSVGGVPPPLLPVGPVFVINDRLDVAKELSAPGIHVGKSDGDLTAIAESFGRRRSSSSSSSPQELITPSDDVPHIGFSINANNLGEKLHPDADLYGVGPIWSTKTKTDATAPMGPDAIRRVAEQLRQEFPDYVLPHDVAIASNPEIDDTGNQSGSGKNKKKKTIVAIGGITRDNCAEAIRHGADGVAVIGDLMDAEDPAVVAADMKRRMREAAVGKK